MPAARALERVLDHIAEHSPAGARLVQARIRRMVALLARFPGAGAPTGRHQVRRVVVSPYPYLIFYRATGDEIVILSIRHAARRPVDP